MNLCVKLLGNEIYLHTLNESEMGNEIFWGFFQPFLLDNKLNISHYILHILHVLRFLKVNADTKMWSRLNGCGTNDISQKRDQKIFRGRREDIEIHEVI